MKYLIVPNDELLLLYAPAFWGIGFGIGWTIAWALKREQQEDYHEWQDFLAKRGGAIFFWLYLLIWFFGYVEN